MQAGYKKVATKLLQKFFQQPHADIDHKEISATLKQIEQKRDLWSSFEEQMMNAINIEEIGKEIWQSEGFIHNMERNIREGKKILQYHTSKKPASPSVSETQLENMNTNIPYVSSAILNTPATQFRGSSQAKVRTNVFASRYFL